MRAEAEHDITFTGSLIADNTNADGSAVSLTSVSGGVTVPLMRITDGTYTVSADSDIAIDTLTATKADGTITSANGGIDGGTWSVTVSSIDAEAKNNITIGTGLTIDNSESTDKVVSFISRLGSFDSEMIELTGGALEIAAANDVRINEFTAINYERIAISALSDSAGYVTYDHEADATSGGMITGGTWSIKNTLLNDTFVTAYADIEIDTSISLDHVKLDLASTTGGFTAQAVNVTNGSDLNVRTATDIAIEHLSGKNSRIYMTSMHNYGRSVNSRTDATGGGRLVASSVELISCDTEVITFGDIVISEKLEASEDEDDPDPDPSLCMLMSVAGGFTLVDGAAETFLHVTDSEFAVYVATDIAADHVIVTDSNATFTALADAYGHSVVSIDSAVGGGDFNAKTVTITNDTADDDTTSITAWMDLIIASDENDDGNGLPDNNVLSAVNTGTGSLTATLNAVTGNLLSDSWFDSWYFDNVTATLTAGGYIVAQDSVTVVNGSDVSITATTDAPASVDFGDGTRYAIYEDEEGTRYYTLDPSVDGDWYTMSITLPYHLETVYLTTWTPDGTTSGTLYFEATTASKTLNRVFGGTFTCADYIWDSDENLVVNDDDDREESAVTVDGASTLDIHTAYDTTIEHLSITADSEVTVTSDSGSANFRTVGAFDSALTVTADQNIAIWDSMTLTNGSTAVLTAQEGYFSSTDSDDNEQGICQFVSLTDSELTISAYTDVAIDHLTATNSTVDITATTGGFTGKTIVLDTSTATYTIYGDIVLESDENDTPEFHYTGNNVLTATDSTVTFTSTVGDMLSDSIHDSWEITHTTLDVTLGAGSLIVRDSVSISDESTVTITTLTGGAATDEFDGDTYYKYSDGTRTFYTVDAIRTAGTVFYIESEENPGTLIEYDVTELTLSQLFDGRVINKDYLKGDIPLCPVENVAGREETFWNVFDSTLTISAASEVEISHFTAENSNVTITALSTDANMTTSTDDANGGGGYTGRTLSFIGGDDRHTLQLLVWGDIVILNDENDLSEVHSADVFTLTDATATIVSADGGLNSDSVHDTWTITNSTLSVTVQNSADIGEGGTFTNSDVCFLMHTGGFTANDSETNKDTCEGDSVIEGRDESELNLVHTTLLVQAAADIEISHLKLDDSVATLSSLADATGESLAYGATATAGGAFISRTIDVVNSALMLDIWGDVTIANDENDGEAFHDDNDVLTVYSDGTSAEVDWASTIADPVYRGVTILSHVGGVYSDTDHDSWYIESSIVTIDVMQDVVIRDTVLVLARQAIFDGNGKTYTLYDYDGITCYYDGEDYYQLIDGELELFSETANFYETHLVSQNDYQIVQDGDDYYYRKLSGDGGYFFMADGDLESVTDADLITRLTAASPISHDGVSTFELLENLSGGVYLKIGEYYYSFEDGTFTTVVDFSRMKSIDGSVLTITSIAGGLTNADYDAADCHIDTEYPGREESAWVIDGSTVTAQMAGDIEISHLTVINAVVTMSSLTIGGESVPAGIGTYSVWLMDDGTGNPVLYYLQNGTFYLYDYETDVFAEAATQPNVSDLVAVEEGTNYILYAYADALYYRSGDTYYLFTDAKYVMNREVLSDEAKEELVTISSAEEYYAYVSWDEENQVSWMYYSQTGTEWYKLELTLDEDDIFHASIEAVDTAYVPTNLIQVKDASTGNYYQYKLFMDETDGSIYYIYDNSYYVYERETYTMEAQTSASMDLIFAATSDPISNVDPMYVTGGGGYTGKTLFASASSLTIDVYDDITITSDENDTYDPLLSDYYDVVLSLSECKSEDDVYDTASGSAISRGATFTSRNGGMDSTDDDYAVWVDESGTLYFEKDGVWYAYDNNVVLTPVGEVDETQLTSASYVVEGVTEYVDAVIDGYTVLEDADGNRYVKVGDDWYAFSYDPAFTVIDAPTGTLSRIENASDAYASAETGTIYNKDEVTYSLRLGTTHLTSSSYNPAYEGKLYFEKSGVYYYYDTEQGMLVAADTLNADFIGIAALLDVGVTNYYDSWLLSNTTFYLDVYDDIDVQDSAFFTNWTVAYLTSSAGGMTNADYFIDHDGDGVGDSLERSKWSINSSYVDMKIHSNIRIDHLFAEISYVTLSSEEGEISSKTWYVLGVRLEVEASGNVKVINMDDTGVVPVPAVQIIWCQDDLLIVSAKATTDGTPAEKFIGLLVSIYSKQGGFTASTCDGYVSSSNTIDFYATGSTIDIEVNTRVSMAETEINVEDPNVTYQTVGLEASSVAGEMVTDTVTHTDIYQYDEAKGKPRSMTDANFPDLHDRAYGSEINIKSHNGDFPANSWQISGAKIVSDATGTEVVNAVKGVTNVNITVLNDIDLIYNLSDRTAEHIEKYGENIASRALTITDGSIVELTSTTGSVDILYNEAGSNYDETNIVVEGEELPAKELVMLGRADDTVSASLTITASGDIRTDVTEASCAALDWYSMDGSIFFDRIEGYRTDVRLEAAGDIFALNNETTDGLVLHNIIRLSGLSCESGYGASSLTLNAGGDIGKTNAWTYLDVDCDVTIEHANNIFIDLQSRDADDMLETIRDYLISYGYTEAAAGLIAQYLIETYDGRDYLSYRDELFYVVMLNLGSDTELRNWVYERANAAYDDGDYEYGWVYTMIHDGELSDALWELVLSKARGSAATATVSTIRSAFGSTVADEISAILADETDPYGYIASGASAEDIFEDIYERTFLTSCTNEYTGTVRIDSTRVRAMFNTLYADGEITYVQDLAGNMATDGTIYDLVNYLFNMDTAYRDTTLNALYSIAVEASVYDIDPLIEQCVEEQANYDEAEADKLAAEAKIAAAQQVIRETEQKQAYLQAQIDALLLEDPVPTSKIKTLQSQIDALDSIYTAQNAKIAAAELEIADANARMDEAQQAMDDINTRIAQINDAYAEYCKDGGESAVSYTEANLKKAYVTSADLTQLYTDEYDIYDVSGSVYYSDGTGMFVLNDCILYTAYFVNGELRYDSGDGWYTMEDGEFVRSTTPLDTDTKVLATELTLGAVLLGEDYTLWIDETSGTRAIYYSLDGADFCAYATGRTSVEQDMHEAEEQISDALQAISDAEAAMALANAALLVAPDLAGRTAAYAALLVAQEKLNAALVNAQNVLAAINAMLVTLNGEDTYSEESLTDAVDQAALLLNNLDATGDYGSLANTIITTAEDFLAEAHNLLTNEQAAWAAAKVDYEAKVKVYEKKLAAEEKLTPGTPEYLIAEQERIDAETDMNTALALLLTFTEDITLEINPEGSGSLDRAWRMVDEAQSALESARTNAMTLQATSDEAFETRETLINTHVDEDARVANLSIGEITGEAYVYNEGDIVITVDRSIDVPTHVELDEGDITLGNIYSERGDITITNRTLYQVYEYEYTDPVTLIATISEYYLAENGTVHVLDTLGRLTAQTAVKEDDLLAGGTLLGVYVGGGSILAATLDDTNPLYANQESTEPGANNYKNDAINDEGQDETVHVNGNLLTFVAKGDIGTAESPLLTEQRDNSPVKVVNADEGLYLDQDADETIHETAFGTAFGERFEELLDPLRNLLLTGETQPTAAVIEYLNLSESWTLEDLRSALAVANKTGDYWYNLLNINQKTYLLALEIAVRYDWLRVDDREVGTDLNARSETGGIFISELTGDMNIGEIYARGDVSLSAPGSIYSTLTTDELDQEKLNIETDGSLSVTAANGTVGTSDNPLYVNVSNFDAVDYTTYYLDTVPTGYAQGEYMGGEMSATSAGGVYLRSEDNLVLNMASDARIVEVETVRLTSTDLNATGDIAVHDIAESATAALSGYAFSLGSVTVTGTADVGTTAVPFEIASVVDSARGIYGTVTLEGDNVYVNQENGDAILVSVIARGDLVLTVPNGSIIDAGNSTINDLLSRLRDAALDANETQNILDELLALQDSITNSGASRQAATDAYNDAEAALTAATNDRDAAQLAATAAEDAYDLALAAYIADQEDETKLQAVKDAYEAMKVAEQDAADAEQAFSDAQAAYDDAAAVKQLFEDFDDANAALAQAVLDRRAAEEAEANAQNDIEAAQAAYDAALLAAGGDTSDPAVVAAKADLAAAKTAEKVTAADLLAMQKAEAAAQTDYTDAFDAMAYYSNFIERGNIHIEEAQEAYDDHAKDNGYTSGTEALAAEAAKLSAAETRLSAAQSAYDLALAASTANPDDETLAAALVTATENLEQAQQDYDDQYEVWYGYETLRLDLQSEQDAVTAAEQRLSDINAALADAKIADENADTALKLAQDAVAAQILVNETQDEVDAYAALAAEAQARLDSATAGSAEYLAAQKELDDALRRGQQAQYTLDAAEYLASTTLAALDAYDAYLAALAAGSVTTEEDAYNEACAAVAEAQSILDKINETNAAQDALDAFNEEHGFEASTSAEIAIEVAAANANLAIAENDVLLAQAALDDAQAAYDLEEQRLIALGLTERQRAVELKELLEDVQLKEEELEAAQEEAARLEAIRDTMVEWYDLTADLELKQSGDRKQGTQQLAVDVLAALDQAYELNSTADPFAAQADDILKCAKYAFEQQLILDGTVDDAEAAATALAGAIDDLNSAKAAYDDAFAVFIEAETELKQAQADYDALVAAGETSKTKLANAKAAIKLAQEARDEADIICAAAALALDEAQTAQANAEAEAIMTAAIPGVDDDPATPGIDESTLLYRNFYDALRMLDQAEEADRTARAAADAVAADAELKEAAIEIALLLTQLDPAYEVVYGEDGLQSIVDLAMEQYLDSASDADSATTAYILALYTLAYLKNIGASAEEIEEAEAVLILKTAEYYQKSNPDIAAIAEEEIADNLAALADAISARDRALDVIYDIQSQIDALIAGTATLNDSDAYQDQQQAAADALTDYYAKEEALVKAVEAARLAQEAYDAAEQAYNDAISASSPNAATIANTGEALAEAQAALDDALAQQITAQTERDLALGNYTSAMRNGLDGMQDITEAAAADALLTAANAWLALTTNPLYTDPATDDEVGYDYAPGDAGSEDTTVQVSGNATIVSGGSVSGEGDGSLSINVGGSLTIDADGNVNIASTGSLQIATIGVGSGTDVQVLAVGNITGSGNPAISADNIALYALEVNGSGADISGDSPMRVDADNLTLIANNASIQNKGDTELGNVIVSGSAVIISGGNITQQSGTSVRASNLTLTASGDITDGNMYDVYTDEDGNVYYADGNGQLYTRDNDGSLVASAQQTLDGLTKTNKTYKGALIVYIDTLSASGADINIVNRKAALVVLSVNGRNVILGSSGSIQTYPKTGIIYGSSSVTVTAAGNIGSPDNYLRVKSDGTVRITDQSSTYGLVYFIRLYDAEEPIGPIVLCDDPDMTGYYMLDEDGVAQRYDRPGTGAEVIGFFTSDAYLWVGTPEETARIAGAAEHTIHITITAGNVVLFDYDIRIDLITGYILDPETGMLLPLITLDTNGKNAGLFMTFRLFIGEEYDGMTFRISLTQDGRTYEILYTVKNGYLMFRLKNLPGEVDATLESDEL